MKVFIHGAAATPTPLLTALCKRQDLADVRLYHLHLSVTSPLLIPAKKGGSFLFPLHGPALRKPVEEGRADFMPIFLADVPRLFTSRTIRLDAAILQLSPRTGTGSVRWHIG